MVFMVYCVWIVLASVWRYIVSLARFPDISVKYHFPINCNLDMVALGDNFLRIPSTEFAKFDMFGYDNAIYSSVLLIVTQALINRIIVIKDLYLHSIVRSISTLMCADTYAIVNSRFKEAKFESVDEVTILALSVEIAIITIFGINKHTAVFLWYIVLDIAFPFV